MAAGATAERRWGHDAEILHGSPDVLHGLGVERALVTCDDGNHGSATVIQRCAGLLQDGVEGDAPLERRHWIDPVRR